MANEADPNRPRLAAAAAPPAQPNQSLIDGMLCLSTLAESPRPLGVSELSRMLGMNRTRTYRMLKTLAHIGFARQMHDRKYAPGPAMGILAAQSLMQLGQSRHLLGPLNKLRRLHLTVAYGALWNNLVIYPYHVPPGVPDPTTLALSNERVHPATRSSIGHVLLAALPESSVREFYQNTSIPNYPGGVDSLIATLKQVRAQGYCALTGEQTRGEPSLAVPVGAPPFAAVALSGKTALPSDAVLGALRTAAQEILEID